jgi:hypothetical protein
MEIKIGSMWTQVGTTGCYVTIQDVRQTSLDYITDEGCKVSCTLDAFLNSFQPTVVLHSAVHAPRHYQVFPDKEAIEIIASSMTTEQFYGYCLGNFLKYRLRIGAKDEVQQELGKSNKYKELYEKHKHLCK